MLTANQPKSTAETKETIAMIMNGSKALMENSLNFMAIIGKVEIIR